MKKFDFGFFKQAAHVGYQHGLHISFGRTACSLWYSWMWKFSIGIKFNWNEYGFSFYLGKTTPAYKGGRDETIQAS